MAPTIIFMGTPEFAAPALHSLHRAGFSIPLVVTQPDRPKGRGKSVQPPPVKAVALSLGLPVVQPVTTKEEAFWETLKGLTPDFLVVVAFGQILPKAVLEIPKFGAINIHPSLLPKYRGPAPIQHAIINGDPVTGVTTILLDEGMDSGEILLADPLPISQNDTSESLHHLLAEKGAILLLKSIDGLFHGTLRPMAQDHDQKSYAPRFKKEDGRIKWRDSAGKIDCFVRGIHPWPGAFTDLEMKRYKIFRVEPVACHMDALPGTVIDTGRATLVVRAGEDAVSILEIQGPSGKRLPISEFLKGHPVSPGAVLT